MAGFADLVKNLVAVADGLTSTLQANVTHYLYSAATKDAYGKLTWGAGTTRACVVERGAFLQHETRDMPGVMITTRGTKLVFPRPVAIDPRDKIVLPDGTTGPILKTTGVTNPTTNAVYAIEVFIGEEGG